MGKFSSGPWIIILGIYFTIFFLITSSIISAAATYPRMDVSGVNIKGINPSVPDIITGYCKDTDHNIELCSTMGSLKGMDGCLLMIDPDADGFINCQWDNVSSCYGGFIGVACNNPDILYNQTLCTTLDCEWSSDIQEAVKIGDTYDWGSVYGTIITMTGFGGDIGIPKGIWWGVFHFFLFWIPAFTLLWAIYMAVPWIH